MTVLSKDDLGHWDCSFEFDPSKHFGFLYCIHNTIDKRYYIGKKQFFHLGKKRSKTYGKEMTWRTYCGSSASLLDDIKKKQHKNFKFDIIDVYNSKGGLYYAEAFTQMVTESMTRHNAEGVPWSYNRQIAAIRFVTKEDLTDRTRRYINKIKRTYK